MVSYEPVPRQEVFLSSQPAAIPVWLTEGHRAVESSLEGNFVCNGI